MTRHEKATLRALLFVSRNEKVLPFPDDDEEMAAAYTKLERDKLVGFSGDFREWWLTWEGEKELLRLQKKTLPHQAIRVARWLLTAIATGIVLYLVERIMNALAA